MINPIQRCFRDKQAPDGTPCAVNTPVTEERNGDALAGESSGLAKHSSDASMQNYASAKADFPHLWGDNTRRAFIGLHDDDEDAVLAILADYLSS